MCFGGKCDAGTFTCACKSNADCAKEDDGNLCNGVWYCNKQSNKFLFNKNSAIVCSKKDDWACEVNTCHPQTGVCQMKARGDGDSCDDGKPCTVAEKCQAGACAAGAKNPCDDGDKCTEDTCAEVGGCAHKAVVCDDGNACTVDGCDKASGQCKVAQPVKEGALCNADGDPCTAGDHCSKGSCKAGAAVNCGDQSNPCLVSVCKAQSDVSFVCVPNNKPDGTPCPGADKGCLYGSVCNAGTCKPGSKSVYGARHFGDPSGWTFFTDVAVGGGGFVAVGGRAVGGHAPVKDARWFVMRFDHNGEPVWKAPLLLAGANAAKPLPDRVASAVNVQADGMIRVAGTTALSNGKPTATVMMISPAGKVVDTRPLPYFSDDVSGLGLAYDRRPGGVAAIGGLARPGTNKQRMAIRKLAASGAPGAAVSFDNTYQNTRVIALVQQDSGRLFSLSRSTKSSYVHGFGADGKEMWTAQPKFVGLDVLGGAVAVKGGSVRVAVGHGSQAAHRRTALLRLDAQTGVKTLNVVELGHAAVDLLGVGALQVHAGTAADSAALAVRDGWDNLQALSKQPEVGALQGRHLALAGIDAKTLVAAGWTAGKSGRRATVTLLTPWGGTACHKLGKCAGLGLASCDDGKPCTRDRCASDLGCVHEPATGFRCPPEGGCAVQASCASGACKNAAAGVLRQGLTADGNTASGAVVDSQKRLMILQHAGFGVRKGYSGAEAADGSHSRVAKCEIVGGWGVWTGGGEVVVRGAHTSGKAGFCHLNHAHGFKLLRTYAGADGKASAYGTARTNDGSYWYGYNTASGERDMRVVLVSHVTGKPVDDRPVLAAGGEEVGHAMTPSANGGVWVGGTRHEKGNGWTALVARVVRKSTKAETLLKATFDLGNGDYVYALAETEDASLIAAGYSTISTGARRGLIMRLQPNLTKLWHALPALADSTTWQAIVPTSDGLFTVAGNRSIVGGGSEVRLIRSGIDGAQIWNRILPPLKGINAVVGRGGLRWLQGAYWLTGSWKTGAAGKGWYARADAWGHTDCHIVGACASLPAAACDDNNPCTADVCNAASGKCAHAPLDDLGCGPSKMCKAGVCAKP